MTQQEFFSRFTYSVRTDKVGGGSFGTVYKAEDKQHHFYAGAKRKNSGDRNVISFLIIKFEI